MTNSTWQSTSHYGYFVWWLNVPSNQDFWEGIFLKLCLPLVHFPATKCIWSLKFENGICKRQRQEFHTGKNKTICCNIYGRTIVLQCNDHVWTGKYVVCSSFDYIDEATTIVGLSPPQRLPLWEAKACRSTKADRKQQEREMKGAEASARYPEDSEGHPKMHCAWYCIIDFQSEAFIHRLRGDQGRINKIIRPKNKFPVHTNHASF